MDQADSLRELFAINSARDELIRCRDKVREAITLGNQDDIVFLMSNLEQAQINFESIIFKNSVHMSS